MPRRPEEWTVDEGYDLTPDMPIKALMDRKPFKLSEDKKGQGFPKALTAGSKKLKKLKEVLMKLSRM